MNVIIIEDEPNLAKQLKEMLSKVAPSYRVVAQAYSISTGKQALEANPSVALIFLDIYLSDGLSFEIFKEQPIDVPVIFTTAYDEHAIEAFDLNSIDYLLKPISEDKLSNALSKFERLAKNPTLRENQEKILHLSEILADRQVYTENFLLPYKDRLIPVQADDFRYFKVIHGVTRGITSTNKMFIMDESLDELNERLDPKKFFRANRQFLIHRKSVVDVEYYFNRRLSLNLLPKPSEQVLVSKAKVREFKDWMSDVK
ncbi:MAG: LytR/AlgR family response regulator transcription factor [Thermonemataceae bacterium]